MSRFSLSRSHNSGRIGASVGRATRGPRPGRRAGLPPRGRAVLLGGIGLAALLLVAWIDGGEEPIHPIVETIDIAESAR